MVNDFIKFTGYESLPEGTIYFVPRVELVRHIFKATGAFKEYLQWDAKQGAVIFNIGEDKL